MRTLTSAVVFLIVAAHCGNALGDDYFYSYFKEEQSLELDRTRIAIYADRGHDEIQSKLADTGAIISQSPLLTGIAFYEAKIDEHNSTTDQVRNLIERIADRQIAEYASPFFSTSEGLSVVIDREIFVRFSDDVSDSRISSILSDVGVTNVVKRDYAGLQNVFRVTGEWKDGFSVLVCANRLAKLPECVFAEPSMIVSAGHSLLIPNDPFFPRLWGHHAVGQDIFAGTVKAGGPPAMPDFDIDAPEAWEFNTGDASVITAVFDSGVQRDHPDMAVPFGTDTTAGGGDGSPTTSCNMHGTTVAGVVGATINNGLLVVGVAPTGSLATVRVLDRSIPTICNLNLLTMPVWIVDGLSWAEAIGARVTSHSYFTLPSSLLTAKFQETNEAGVVHFASAGNNGNATVNYPARLDSVAAVTALDPFIGDLASTSSFGIGLSFSAPGVSILTTDRSGTEGYSASDFIFASGSSYAVPFAAGVAALVLSEDPTLTSDEVIQIMEATAVDLGNVGYDTRFGWGFVNAANGVRLARCQLLADGCGRDGPLAECELGDFDGDLQVGLGDFSSWPDCETGPNGQIADDCCRVFDLNVDGHVDRADFWMFQRIFGAGR